VRTADRAFIVAGALTLASASNAQISVAPESVRVVLPQHQELAVGLVLANGGAASLAYCLDFDRPLQRAGDGGLGADCGEPGELLATFDTSDYPGAGSFNPNSLTMTSLGRLFASELGDVTYEFTSNLQYVRRYTHPKVNELDVTPLTVGVTFDADSGTMWWTNEEAVGQKLLRYLLLEGTLDGVATGRRIELPRVPAPPEYPNPWAFFYGASYSPATGRFYYSDPQNEHLWAIDTTGSVPDGYPLSLEAHPPPPSIDDGPLRTDVHGEGVGPTAERIEVQVVLGAFPQHYYRVEVTDPRGRDLGLPATPLDEVQAIEGDASPVSFLRSRMDPNGVMYVTYVTFGPQGIAAIRPQPLAPSWLGVLKWRGDIPAGGSVQVPLTFRAGQRAPGEYRSTLVVEDTAGVVLASVPLTLVVEPATPANEPGAAEAGLTLSVSPNPVALAGAVTVTLARPAAFARVAMFDVLGRQVGGLHDGPLPAGASRLPLDASALPAGIYVVRATTAGGSLSRRVTVAH